MYYDGLQVFPTPTTGVHLRTTQEEMDGEGSFVPLPEELYGGPEADAICRTGKPSYLSRTEDEETTLLFGTVSEGDGFFVAIFDGEGSRAIVVRGGERQARRQLLTGYVFPAERALGLTPLVQAVSVMAE